MTMITAMTTVMADDASPGEGAAGADRGPADPCDRHMRMPGRFACGRWPGSKPFAVTAYRAGLAHPMAQTWRGGPCIGA